MAISVGQFAIADDGTGTSDTDRYFNSASKSIELTWAAGDTIIAFWSVGTGNDIAPTAPTGTGLSFTNIGDNSHDNADESEVAMWHDKPTGSGTNVTVTCNPSNPSGRYWSIVFWVISGDVDSYTVLTPDVAESAWNRTTAVGDLVIFAFDDWNATNPPNKTPETASGTVTKRVDVGDNATHAVWCADWVDTDAATDDFGPTNFTSLQVARAAIHLVPAAGGGSAVPTPRLSTARRHLLTR